MIRKESPRQASHRSPPNRRSRRDGGNRYHSVPAGNLESYAPGDIIDTRTIAYRVAGLPLPANVVQIKYRSTDHDGNPAYNFTSVVVPPANPNGRLVSLHSVYDSLDPAHSPSRAIAGDIALGMVNSYTETATIAQMLLDGYTVAVTDIEGQDAALFDGPTYGRLTLDGIRAALRTPETGLTDTAPVGLIGYSGGSVASAWAAQLAPTYAPEINDQLAGTAAGGVPTNLINMVRYVDGAPFWGPMTVPVLIGMSPAYDFDLDPYLSDYGQRMMRDLSRASFAGVNLSFAGVDWASLFRPEYQDPRSIPELVAAVNRSNALLGPNPTVPAFIAQADNGPLTGTPDGPDDLGSGDGVILTGDTRALAHKYCDPGAPVTYREFPILEHSTGFLAYATPAWSWLQERFDGVSTSNDCATIPAGNVITPVTPVAPAAQKEPEGLAGLRDQLSSNGSSPSS